jgi:hypothetical protein
LFDGLPEDARPQGADDVVPRERANSWLAQNAVGKVIEVRCPVGRLEVTRQPDGRDAASLIQNGFPEVTVHGAQWRLMIRGPGQALIPLVDADEAALSRLRGLRGGDLTIRGRVHRLAFAKQPQIRRAELWVEFAEATIEESQP